MAVILFLDSLCFHPPSILGLCEKCNKKPLHAFHRIESHLKPNGWHHSNNLFFVYVNFLVHRLL